MEAVRAHQTTCRQQVLTCNITTRILGNLWTLDRRKLILGERAELDRFRKMGVYEYACTRRKLGMTPTSSS